MNLRQMIEDFRDDLLIEADDLPNNMVISLLNRKGVDLIDADAYAIERQYSFAAVAGKSFYALPGDFFDLRMITIDNEERTSKTDHTEMMNAKLGYGSVGEPYLHAIWQDQLHLHSTPGSSATATTLAGTITASATSITVVTPSGGLPGRGCIQIDSEKIYFDTVTASGSNSILTNVQRGREDTAAAAHSDGATVTVLNIELSYFARYREFLKCPETGRADLGTGGALLTAGRHYLLWTYYDSVRGLESYPHDLYSLTSAATNTLALTNLVDAADLKQYQKKIYMTKADYSQPYYLVTTLNAGTNSYTIDVADSSLVTAFDWDSVGGSNMPDELRSAQLDFAIAKYLKRSKRYGEAVEFEGMGAAKWQKGVRVIRGRRNVAAMSRMPDIIM